MMRSLATYAVAALAVLSTRFPLLHASSHGLGDTDGGRVTGPEHAKKLRDDWENADALSSSSAAAVGVLAELRASVDVMQTRYFELWVGKWPNAIDWTAAVVNTHLVAVLESLTGVWQRHAPTAEAASSPPSTFQTDVDNEINQYFAQISAYYFAEDILALRNEAYDDMLWVVLGWLEAIKLIDARSSSHQRHASAQAWHGTQFIPPFAHRARVFYDIAAQGYDTTLCGGGMVWNPNLGPYKNAITNELYISAAVGMYLYYPGDNNSSPFAAEDATRDARVTPTNKPLDRSYLAAAIEGYDWFRRSNFTNDKGLIIDGFHITGWDFNGSIGTGKCDDRNEMVYSYNQGVILSGLRDLWESTGNRTYLNDGHALVRNTIRATGWDMEHAPTARNSGSGSGSSSSSRSLPEWAGLGRAGVIEDTCDASASCNQDGQAFKGIFFHHLTLFCQPLPLTPRVPGTTFAADRALASLHHASCRSYTPWVAHNARAALASRDEHGRFGTWWRPASGHRDAFDSSSLDAVSPQLPDGAIDYRNAAAGLPADGFGEGAAASNVEVLQPLRWQQQLQQLTLADPATRPGSSRQSILSGGGSVRVQDANDRGRGRTVETQGGGVAVLRAWLELLDHAA